ncbi:hypothetical protein PGB90_003584 [Kerria lacca]
MSDKRLSLRGLITQYRSTVTALEITLKENPQVDVPSQFCIHSFLSKSDKGTRADWERKVAKRKTFATFNEFLEYVEERCNAFERTTGGSGSMRTISQAQKRKVFSATEIANRICFDCKREGHRHHTCSKFLEFHLHLKK